MEIGIGEGKRSTRTKTKIDGLKDRRLAAVARPDQAIYRWTRQLAKGSHRPKILDFKHTDQRPAAFSPLVRHRKHPLNGRNSAALDQSSASPAATWLDLTYNANALHRMV
jgi:hypothetical protein